MLDDHRNILLQRMRNAIQFIQTNESASDLTPDLVNIINAGCTILSTRSSNTITANSISLIDLNPDDRRTLVSAIFATIIAFEKHDAGSNISGFINDQMTNVIE